MNFIKKWTAKVAAHRKWISNPHYKAMEQRKESEFDKQMSLALNKVDIMSDEEFKELFGYTREEQARILEAAKPYKGE